MRRHWCLVSLLTISLIYALTAAQEPAATATPEKIRQAMDRGIKFLAIKKGQDHNWESHAPFQLGDYQGGVTGLVCLALLEAGVKPNEAPLKESLHYLRLVKLNKTYCQGLRMAVLAHIVNHYPALSAAEDKGLIVEDRSQLMQFAARENGGRLIGWGYPVAAINRPDFSNTHFAVMGLQAAHEAGIETSKEDWQAVRELFLRTQNDSGGWGYTADNSSDHLTMTLAGIGGLSASCKELKEAPPPKSIDLAFKLVSKRLRPQELFEQSTSNTFPYYTLFALSRASSLTQVKELKAKTGKDYNIYDELAAQLLKQQAADGSWGTEKSMIDQQSILATSFTLIYLARGQAK